MGVWSATQNPNNIFWGSMGVVWPRTPAYGRAAAQYQPPEKYPRTHAKLFLFKDPLLCRIGNFFCMSLVVLSLFLQVSGPMLTQWTANHGRSRG